MCLSRERILFLAFLSVEGCGNREISVETEIEKYLQIEIEKEKERERERWNMEDRDAIKFRGIFWNDTSSIM